MARSLRFDHQTGNIAPPLKILTALALSTALLAASCGGGGDEFPSGEIAYTSGTAQLTMSGDEEGTFDLELSSLGSNDFVGENGEGFLSLAWSSGDVHLGIDLEFEREALIQGRTSVGMDMPSGATFATAIGGAPCAVDVTFVDGGVEGSFTCPDLAGRSSDPDTGEADLTVEADGTFSASE